MIVVTLAFAVSQDLGPSGIPIGNRTRTEAAYDHMYSCYVDFMERKGFDSGTPAPRLKRWDKAARTACSVQIHAYRRRVGNATLEAEWSDIWSDYSSKD